MHLHALYLLLLKTYILFSIYSSFVSFLLFSSSFVKHTHTKKHSSFTNYFWQGHLHSNLYFEKVLFFSFNLCGQWLVPRSLHFQDIRVTTEKDCFFNISRCQNLCNLIYQVSLISLTSPF